MSAHIPTRSPRGCLTCKQRRKKCDETRPVCQRCKQGKFKCLGYAYLDSLESLHNSLTSRTKRLAETPLFSYQPMLLPSSDAQGLPPSAKSSPAPLTPVNHPQVLISHPVKPPERRRSELVTAAVTPTGSCERQHSESIPRILRLESEHINKVVELVLSQMSRLGYRIFMPGRIQADAAVARRAYRSDLLRWCMYLGAQITQMLLDGLGRKNYLDIIRRFHQQIVSNSPLVVNSDPTTRLSGALDLCLYACMVSNSAAGYSIFRNTTPLWYQLAANFPLVWSHGSTVSLAYAISVPRYELSKFILWDIICALAFGTPSILQYDTTCEPVNVHKSYLEWVYGCPLPFIVLLAKINASRNRPLVLRDQHEIEMHLKQWDSKSIYPDKDSCKIVARLAVQESWRQAIYIYLYMGMCNADSADPRVEAAVRQIFLLSSTVQSTNPLGIHLFAPCFIASVAARAENHRAMLRSRIYAYREANSWILTGADFVPVFDHLWRGAARDGRPVTWDDYVRSRSATLTVEG